jgi:peptidoglycan LD-endopeptidase LytH
MRAAIAFFAGFVAGMLFLIVLLWRSGSLQPVRAAVAPPPPPTAAPQPLPAPVTAPLPSAITAPPPLRAPLTPPPPPIALPQPSLQAGVPDLVLPVQGVKASQILDTFDEGRDGRRHEAVDIMAARGTPVMAADDGTIAKLFNSQRGGITIYEFDPTQTWCYYYAHLDRYAEGIQEKMTIRKGQVIGYVGSTGDASAEAPHLHFAIFKLGPEKHWWQGTAINPYPILRRHANADESPGQAQSSASPAKRRGSGSTGRSRDGTHAQRGRSRT